MNDLKKAVEVLKAGGVVMHPTETCYGLAVDVFNENALEKLYRLKGRDFDKPVSILVTGLEMAETLGSFSEKARELAEKYWPGPLSIVVPRKAKLPEFLNSGMDFISFRVSSDVFTQQMVAGFASSVTTTSANVSGQQPLYEADLSVFGENKRLVDMVVDGGKIEEKPPSTVVKVVADNLEVLREGTVSL